MVNLLVEMALSSNSYEVAEHVPADNLCDVYTMLNINEQRYINNAANQYIGVYFGKIQYYKL